MRAWYFTEMPYPHLPPHEEMKSMRLTLPNKFFDPRIGHQLLNRYLDEYCYADQMGLNLMVNEHRSSVVCLDVAGPLSLAILARQTRNGRLLILGNSVANRDDPIRVAEEMAMVDCISGGRLECGMVRGVTYEIFAANTNPTMTNERLWEAVDMVTKAWTSHEGPFNYEGNFWHRRNVNIWPRPFQQPRPRIWVTGSNDYENLKHIAEQGHVFATFVQPYEKVRQLFDAYRGSYRLNGQPGGGGTAFMPLVYVADTESEAEAGMKQLLWYMAAKTEPQYRNPPGYVPVEFNVKALQGTYAGRTDAMRAQTLEFQREQGVVMYGTPDQVIAQIKRFYDLVGGFDHLLMMMQAGFLDHESTCKNIRLFAKEVYPAIKDLAGTKPLDLPIAAE